MKQDWLSLKSVKPHVRDRLEMISEFGSDFIAAHPLNILCVMNGDIRHVLKTIAQSWRHPRKQLNVRS
jgi:hypothetical protein